MLSNLLLKSLTNHHDLVFPNSKRLLIGITQMKQLLSAQTHQFFPSITELMNQITLHLLPLMHRKIQTSMAVP